MTSTQEFDYAIIGGGAAGTMVAIRLLEGAQVGTRIALIEAGEPGRGVAYGSDNPAHVLNVPAGGMSLFAERPDDFVEFLRARDGEVDAAAFVPRREYAAYLAQRLDEALQASAAEWTQIRASVSRVQPRGDVVVLDLDEGHQVIARHVALAPGNRARAVPFSTDGDRRVLSAWDHAGLQQIGLEDSVVMVGSGLSMVDVVLGLQARGHRGDVTVVSRHALLPLPHAANKHKLSFDIDSFAELGLRDRAHRLRAVAREMNDEGLPWQYLMDALRHHVRQLWQSLSMPDQRRFLRHAVRYWDVHRHRIPCEVASRLQSLRDAGVLTVMPGRVTSAMADAGGLAIDVDQRGAGAARLNAGWLVNATGIETRAAHYPNPMLRALLEDGVARPGPLGLGLDTAAHAGVINAQGLVQPNWAAIGRLRLGKLWETTAVPDLRVDAFDLAKRWLQQD